MWFAPSFKSDFEAEDKELHTPITTVLAEWDRLTLFASIKKNTSIDNIRSDAVEVIFNILSKIDDNSRIKAIKKTYCGTYAIEYDIKSGNGIITEVKVNIR